MNKNHNDNKEVISEILMPTFKLKCKNVAQKSFAKLIEDKEIVISSGPAGTGKAQSLTSKVLTPIGWKTMGDLEVGDFVVGDDGKPSEILQIHPQGEIEMYGIYFSDGSYTECCENHLWYTETYNDRNHRTRNKDRTRVFSPRKGSVKSTKEIIKTLHTKRGDNNHTIPMVKPVEFEEIKLIVDPYIMGCILGDGGITQNRITFTTADNEIADKINYILTDDLILEKLTPKYSYSIKAKKMKHYGNSYLNEFRDLKLIGKTSYNKHIPNKYLFNSVENRIGLLQGLMDTDGYVDKRKYGSCYFISVSIDLINGVIELVQSLGGKCILNSKIPTYSHDGEKKYGKLAYTLTISMPPNINPFRLHRKANLVTPKVKYIPKRYITDIKPIGKKKAKCISIDNESKLYVTDDYIVTHNSYISIGKALELLKSKNTPYNKLLIAKPVVEVDGNNMGYLPGGMKEKMDPYMRSTIDIIDEIIGIKYRKGLESSEILIVEPLSFLRGKTINKSIFIMEEAQNMSPIEMKTLLSRIGHDSKMIISGDMDQSDKYKNVKDSGLYDAIKRHQNIDEIGFFTFIEEDIVRNPLITKILINYRVPEPYEKNE